MQTHKAGPQAKVLAETNSSSLPNGTGCAEGPLCLGEHAAVVILEFFMLFKQGTHIFNLHWALQTMSLLKRMDSQVPQNLI